MADRPGFEEARQAGEIALRRSEAAHKEMQRIGRLSADRRPKLAARLAAFLHWCGEDIPLSRSRLAGWKRRLAGDRGHIERDRRALERRRQRREMLLFWLLYRRWIYKAAALLVILVLVVTYWPEISAAFRWGQAGLVDAADWVVDLAAKVFDGLFAGDEAAPDTSPGTDG